MSDTFHKLVFDIAEQLNVRDHEALNYIYNLPDSNSSRLKSFQELEKRGLFSHSNISGLCSILNQINRSDLVEMVERYKQSLSASMEDSSHGHKTGRREEIKSSSTVGDSGELVRIKLCFLQAKEIKERLGVFQKENLAFSKQDLTDSASIRRQFCKGMNRRLKKLEEDLENFLVSPLKELMDSSRDSSAAHATCFSSRNITMSSKRTSEDRHDVRHTVTPPPPPPPPHKPYLKATAPLSPNHRVKSHSVHSLPNHLALNSNEEQGYVDYDTLLPPSRVVIEQRSNRVYFHASTATSAGARTAPIPIKSANGKKHSCEHSLSDSSSPRSKSKIPVPTASPTHRRYNGSQGVRILSQDSCDYPDIDGFLSSVDSGISGFGAECSVEEIQSRSIIHRQSPWH